MQIKLTKEEAELLNRPPMILWCPYKYYTNQRRVWWVDNVHTNLQSINYSICQDCYHNNRLNNPSITKDDLVPIIIDNLPCNCDARTDEESYQVQLPKCLIAIYILEPVFTLPEIKYEVNDKQIDILVLSPYKKCTYIVNILSEADLTTFDNKTRIIVETTPEGYDTTNKIFPLGPFGKFHFDIDKILINDKTFKSLEYADDNDACNSCNIKIIQCQIEKILAKPTAGISNRELLYDINIHIAETIDYEYIDENMIINI